MSMQFTYHAGVEQFDSYLRAAGALVTRAEQVLRDGGDAASPDWPNPAEIVEARVAIITAAPISGYEDEYECDPDLYGCETTEDQRVWACALVQMLDCIEDRFGTAQHTAQEAREAINFARR